MSDAVVDRLDKILEALQLAAMPLDKRLWTAAQAATYLQVSEHHLVTRYIHREEFPRPIWLPSTTPGGKSPKTRRWVASEIVEWAQGYQE